MPDLDTLTRYVEASTRKLFLDDFIKHINSIIDCYNYIYNHDFDADYEEIDKKYHPSQEYHAQLLNVSYKSGSTVVEFYTRVSYLIEHDLAIVQPMLPIVFEDFGKQYTFTEIKDTLIESRKAIYAYYEDGSKHEIHLNASRFISALIILLKAAVKDYNKGNYNVYNIVPVDNTGTYKAVRKGFGNNTEGIFLNSEF